jgi:C1A family cysteine protease
MSDNPQAPNPVNTPAEVKIYRQRVSFLGWKPDKPDVRDWKYDLSRMAGESAMPQQATLPGADKFLPPIRNQGQQGSCTGHGTRSACQYLRAAEGQQSVELSPRFAYYNGRVIEGTTQQDGGAEIRDVVKGIAKLGIAAEVLCPYSDQIYIQRPSKNAYKEALSDVVTNYRRVDVTDDQGRTDPSKRRPAIKQAILQREPVVFGFSVYENFMTEQVANSGLMPMPTGSMDGGHCVWICAYDDSMLIHDQLGGVLCGNSWGTDWGCVGPTGERGYFWMPWSLVCDGNFSDDYWALNTIS